MNKEDIDALLSEFPEGVAKRSNFTMGIPRLEPIPTDERELDLRVTSKEKELEYAINGLLMLEILCRQNGIHTPIVITE